MPLPFRQKLVGLRLESLGPSPDVPACEELRLVALLMSDDGSTHERDKLVLAYPGVMRDADQFPFFLANELRGLMSS